MCGCGGGGGCEGDYGSMCGMCLGMEVGVGVGVYNKVSKSITIIPRRRIQGKYDWSNTKKVLYRDGGKDLRKESETDF